MVRAMKIAIVYMSVHHGNTEKLIRAAKDCDFYRADDCQGVDFSQYDLVGLASGIYAAQFHQSLNKFVDEHIEELSKVFLVYTAGFNFKMYGLRQQKKLLAKGLTVKGIYFCKGFDTFGPLKLFGGTGKGRPNEKDQEEFVAFLENLRKST
jgi:flavodoxin